MVGLMFVGSCCEKIHDFLNYWVQHGITQLFTGFYFARRCAFAKFCPNLWCVGVRPFVFDYFCGNRDRGHAFFTRLAAVLGNQTNYTIGRYFGPRVFQWENSKFFNKEAFEQAHAFYEKYGGPTIIAARFMPFVRTFAPFVAGVAQMTRRKFSLFDITGALLWVGGVVMLGYTFGATPWVQKHFDKVIWALFLIPGLLALIGAVRARRQ
jgi:membrane protein YqaA with SNARE-associated domain